MAVARRLPFNSLRIGRIASSFPSSASARSRSDSAALPGGFSADGLREWAVLTSFGAYDHDALTGGQWRRRRRRILDDPGYPPYADMFSRTVTAECKDYLVDQSSPSDALGRAFFGSWRFAGERRVLTSLNALFSMYPGGATTLPARFERGDRYLQWKVSAKAPLELICSYEVGGSTFRGCTMLAFDPSLGRAYHGNVVDVLEEKTRGLLPAMGVRMHVRYAEFLLTGMVDDLEKKACQRE